MFVGSFAREFYIYRHAEKKNVLQSISWRTAFRWPGLSRRRLIRSEKTKTRKVVRRRYARAFLSLQSVISELVFCKSVYNILFNVDSMLGTQVRVHFPDITLTSDGVSVFHRSTVTWCVDPSTVRRRNAPWPKWTRRKRRSSWSRRCWNTSRRYKCPGPCWSSCPAGISSIPCRNTWRWTHILVG